MSRKKERKGREETCWPEPRKFQPRILCTTTILRYAGNLKNGPGSTQRFVSGITTDEQRVQMCWIKDISTYMMGTIKIKLCCKSKICYVTRNSFGTKIYGRKSFNLTHTLKFSSKIIKIKKVIIKLVLIIFIINNKIINYFYLYIQGGY